MAVLPKQSSWQGGRAARRGTWKKSRETTTFGPSESLEWWNKGEKFGLPLARKKQKKRNIGPFWVVGLCFLWDTQLFGWGFVCWGFFCDRVIEKWVQR